MPFYYLGKTLVSSGLQIAWLAILINQPDPTAFAVVRILPPHNRTSFCISCPRQLSEHLRLGNSSGVNKEAMLRGDLEGTCT